MNTSAKGSAYENEARRILETHGYETLRSAASKGPFDVVVWGRGKIGFFQMKSRMTCAAAERLLDELPRPPYGDVAVVHPCRKRCRSLGHRPEPHCMHVYRAGEDESCEH